ncbi:MAG: ABC transporter permease subunit [Phycisphaerae bacterium]|nr:ABC transporter permease subunit [Phycisphaerae bacterium]
MPANPILVRVVHAGGRRVRHLWIRVGYLSVLAVAVVIGVIFAHQAAGGTSLADLAKQATRVFQYVSIIQLGMVCILAPIFTAAAITQEKDAQTYSILLSTPLTNGQIVLGSLLSRFFFVSVLLLAGVPLFCIMMVYGGVTGDKIVMSIALAASTALFTGSLAITISVIKVGTGRTIFSFYLTIAIYLIVVYSLASWPGVIPPEAEPAPSRDLCMSWLAAFHPFLALWVVLGKTPAPAYGATAHYGFPGGYLLAYPQYSYMVMTILASLLLILLSLFFVRRGAKEGEVTFFSRLLRRAKTTNSTSERTRKPRHVRRNPIAWREAVTSASAGGGQVLRYSVFGTGLVIGLVLLVYYGQGALTVAQTRLWLYGIVAVELGITLFVATTTAATSMTREKESNTIELVLSTPMTSDTIIRGKIWGLVHSAGPLLLVPYITAGLFVLFDLISGRTFADKGTGPVVGWEATITLPVLFVCFTAFACMIGLHWSIKSKKTMGAVFTSTGIVIGVFAATAGCAFSMKSAGNDLLTAAFMPLTPVTAVFIAVDPASAVGATTAGATVTTCRVIAFIASFCSAAVYGLIGYAMHRSMVRNFDMVIRKQSA